MDISPRKQITPYLYRLEWYDKVRSNLTIRHNHNESACSSFFHFFFVLASVTSQRQLPIKYCEMIIIVFISLLTQVNKRAYPLYNSSEHKWGYLVPKSCKFNHLFFKKHRISVKRINFLQIDLSPDFLVYFIFLLLAWKHFLKIDSKHIQCGLKAPSRWRGLTQTICMRKWIFTSCRTRWWWPQLERLLWAIYIFMKFHKNQKSISSFDTCVCVCLVRVCECVFVLLCV